MVCVLNILKITASLSMIVFAIKLFSYSKKVKILKLQTKGRENNLQYAEKLAARGATKILVDELINYSDFSKDLKGAEIDTDYYTMLLSISSIVLAVLEILLTFPQLN